MKETLIFTGIFFISFSIFAQDAKSILMLSYNKCQSVQNGYYEMTKQMKYMTSKDTSISSVKGSFKKLPDDTIHTAAFHYKQFWQNEFTGEILYTGENLVIASGKDSTATIMSKSLWSKEIKANSRNQKFYSPLMSKKSSPLPNEAECADNTYTFKYIGEENVNGILCYHVQANENLTTDSTEIMKKLRNERHFWINKTDLIPIQYSITYDMVMNNDTMHQFEINKLTKYEVNKVKDESQFNLESIPGYYRIKDFSPSKNPVLLPKDTIAPNWELLSTEDKRISLTSLRGSLVLLDFFYKSCYPCMQSLPALQALNEKYKDKGLKVIGIDPYDNKEDGISSFLTKRGVTYTVLLGGKDVAQDYRVSGYPTMYLIDKNGKIIYIQEGFGMDVEKMLDDLIQENL